MTTYTVSSGVTSSGLILGASDQLNVNAGGIATSTTVNSGGIETVYAGGVANSTTINNGGYAYISSGGIASGTSVSSGGGEVVFSGGTARFATISNLGNEYVFAGGTASSTTIKSGGIEYLYSGGVASFTTISNGGSELIFAGGTASGTVVSSGGVENINSGGVADGTTIRNGGTAVVRAGAVLNGIVLDTGGTIDLQSVAFTSGGSATLDSTTDVLTVTEGSNTTLIQLAGSYDGLYFHTTADTDGSTLITADAIPCYCRGTRILTERGEVAVENLVIGDRLITHSLPDGRTARALRWIGRRSYGGRFAAANRDVLPVCIHAGALADDIPYRDLWVSPLHALYLDGMLVPAAALVNGISITWAEDVDQVAYFHLELDGHAVILAEGAPAESFVDDGSRGMFQNASDYEARYPDSRAGPARYCAPRVEQGEALEALRIALAARAGLGAAVATATGRLAGHVERADHSQVTGWVRDEGAPDAAVRLHILADETLLGEVLANRFRGDLLRAGVGSGRHGFMFRIPGALSPYERHTIHVRCAADGRDVPGTPIVVEPRSDRARVA